MSKFIATEPLNIAGEKGEQIVWHQIKNIFATRDCLAYWRYPIFTSDSFYGTKERAKFTQEFRKEPDILIADYELGLIIIETKSIKIEQILSIQGYRWQYHNFYTEYGNPYQQAANQMYALLRYCDREPILTRQVTARVLIALPYITEQQWQSKGFNLLPANPPILFQDSLVDINNSYHLITNAPCLIRGNSLTVTQWELLQGVLAGTPVYSEKRVIASKINRHFILQQARSRLPKLDLAQETIAKQIPPGMQRIRGVAGSGKTVLLCQKAVIMTLKYPDWQIALVFFSRSLYDVIIQQIERWLNYYRHNQQSDSRETSNLKILHAWGSKNQPGFYSTICQSVQKLPLSVNHTISKKPHEALAEVCTQLLETTAIPQLFDAVLIDEAQDLISDNWHYHHKQPFYWLAYQALRPVNPVNPQQKRLIWAYDEIQALNSFKIPDALELFGEDLGHLVTGIYEDQIQKTEILTNCYRTPQQILTVANAIAIGLLRNKGLLIKLRNKAEWASLGYRITGKLAVGNEITVQYSLLQEINPVVELSKSKIIEFHYYISRQQELTALANNINHNLNQEQLQPDRGILVIVVGDYQDTIELQQLTAKFLMRQGISIYLPGNNNANSITKNPQQNPNLFWYPGAVTISTIHRAKGQEADLVYIVGLDYIARDESNLYLRNQLFIALTRTRGWAYLSGISQYEFYQELTAIINSKNCFKLVYQEDFKREIGICDRTMVLKGYAMGSRNFRYANLQQADLSYKNLAQINLIAADLTGANLTGANLSHAKLIEANLTGANLTKANLSHAKLMGANLKNAVLSEANIDRADLTNIVL